jgi:hypothetical protein
LYVPDWYSCVWKVKTDHKVDKWLEGVGSVGSLSVKSEGHIVVLERIYGEDDKPVRSEDGDDEERADVMLSRSRTVIGRVDIYDTDGVKLSSLQLPPDIETPWHVVQTVNKSFIVCHGVSVTGLHRVCEVNNEGVRVKSYGGSPGSELRLDQPQYIALDSEERVFVADYNNHRVLLLDKQLNIQRVLLTWSSDWPRRLFYDRETTQLIVGLSSGRVEIFSWL